MLTQCPRCQTTFRVTSEILRVAEGQVRCGRCHTQFDALARLIEEADAGEVESGRYLRPPPESDTQPSDDVEVEESETGEEITMAGRHIEISGRYPAVDAQGAAQIHEETTEEWIEIDDPDTTAEQDEPAPEEQPALDELEASFLERSAASRAADTRHARQDERDAGEHEPDSEPDLEPDTEPEPALDLEPEHPRGHLKWTLLAAPLVLLILAQGVHHYRAALALHPEIGPPLLRAYATLGLPLQPAWDLHAYEILQWHVGSDPAAPGTLKVRATLRNGAAFAQPYPHLKLVLEDRWGEQVRARAFAPADYLDEERTGDLLAPAEQTAAAVSIVDPGPDAEGFRLDVCLSGSRGVVCAEEVPKRRL